MTDREQLTQEVGYSELGLRFLPPVARQGKLWTGLL